MPDITVYVTTRDRENLLPRAIGSLFTQTLKNWHCIIVDDGSNDTTPELVKQFERDPRIRSIRMSKPVGSCAARNAAIAEVSTQFVTGLDDDDMFMPTRLERLLAKRSTGSIVGSRDLTIKAGKAVVTRRPDKVSLSTILRRNVLGNQALMSTADVRAVGGFDESLPSSQDHDLWVRLIERCGPANILTSLGQVIFEDAVPDRITSNSAARIVGMEKFFAKHHGKMSNSCKHAYQGRTLAIQGQRSSIRHSILGLDPSIEGLKEVRRALATAFVRPPPDRSAV